MRTADWRARKARARALAFALAGVLALVTCACVLTWAGANPASNDMITEASDNLGIAASGEEGDVGEFGRVASADGGNAGGDASGGGAGVMTARANANANEPPTLEGVPQDFLDKLAEEQGIYPGSAQLNADGRVVWTVYDAANPNDAAVMATVTLPADAEVYSKSYLYIRPVDRDEDYYPKDDAISAVASETNDVQCYAIHWVKLYREDDGLWAYGLNTSSVLGKDDDASKAQVEISYLKEDARLEGHQAQRKLQVYNSREKNGAVLEENATPTSVSASDVAYTGFTFETNRGGPYVFVSKKLFEGYVSSVTMDKIVDGTSAFDDNDGLGNDSSDSNKIVRSYDQIMYSMKVNYAARSSLSTATEAEVCFEMTLEADITEATFGLGQMLWLKDPTIEYLDKDGQVIYRQDGHGDLCDASGKAVTINDIAADSQQGAGSYLTSIASQRLRGNYLAKDKGNVLAANQIISACVQVLGAHNESSIKPAFRVWFKGNEDNYGSENKGEGSDVALAEIMTGNMMGSEPIKVSAAARFNLELAKNSNVSYRGWFDSATGKEVNASNPDDYTVGGKVVSGAQLYELLEQLAALEENRDKANPEEFTDGNRACSAYLQGASLGDYASTFKSIRYGRLTGYGTTLQIYNTAGKGFKGVSLPQGDISFDLALDTLVKKVGADASAPGERNDQYYSQLWEYNENETSQMGNQDKNLYWADLESTKYAAWAAPYNKGSNESSCYNGGKWTLGDDGGYHFTVSSYDLNFLLAGLSFPTHKAGNSGATSGYNNHIGSFSAGYVQVLNVFPRAQSETLNLSTEITVKNLRANTTDVQGIGPIVGDETGYAHEMNKGDNVITDSIPLYAPGGMTKANAFCDAVTYDSKSTDFTARERFLGTYFWDTSYDCSGFAGQRITLVGAARISAGDYRIKHMNMLQLFDSKALSISEGKDPYVVSSIIGHTEGETTILYAADPDYRRGYDTNDKSIMNYMSTVREEDLIYYKSLKELESDDYTCVGVMAELRDWDIPAESGYRTALKIAVDISDSEDNLAKTIGTVNAVRIWTNTNDMKATDDNGVVKYVSWADGANDPNQVKNSVPGYTPVRDGDSEHYSGEVANGSSYEKTEYENGQFVMGTNTGGYVYGSSLLILGYKSEVNIAVENGGEGAQRTFDMGKGQFTVEYRLSGITAKLGDAIGAPRDKKTNLTIPVKLDTDKPNGQTDQRIAISEGSYAMVPASDLMVLVDAEGNALTRQSLEISSDPNHPTEVLYCFKDGSTGALASQTYVIQVYAQRDSNGEQVTFKVAGVTLDVAVPDITFDALIEPQAVKNNEAIEATANIGGTEDVRAYSKTEGNQSKVSIGIIKLASTRLVKSVDKRYIELDGTYTYTVSYANTGSSPVNVYLYDLLPNANDTRGSNFNGTVELRKVAARIAGDDDTTAKIDLYYSTEPYKALYEKVSEFGNDGSGRDADAIMDMLTEKDGPFKLLETVDVSAGNELVSSGEMSDVTGIYAVVGDLKGASSLEITLTGQAQGNEAGDLYRNLANSWLGGTDEPLKSNLVETSALARAINGVVWEDADLDGVREAGEKLIPNVTCTLFRLEEDEKSLTNGKYVKVDKDITGTAIYPVTTGGDGAYSFDKLPAGKYVVAFSGDVLGSYKGATTYRVKGDSGALLNDAVALSETPFASDTEVQALAGIGEGYKYVIAYDLSTSGEGTNVTNTAEAVPLHTIDEIVGGNITLINNVELHENLDCGLVKDMGYELPETGGAGVAPLQIAGTALVASAALMVGLLRRRRTS